MRSSNQDRNQPMALSKPTETQPANEKTWQQTKSEKTRTAILDAALYCFYELGYGNTTTEKVAKRAGVSRGAMLHHFPSRMDLIRASILHLNDKRLEAFEVSETKINEGAEHTKISEGIDAYWEQLHSPLFTVFHELQVAARTDKDLRDVMIPALSQFDASWGKVARSVFPDLAMSEEFYTANLLTLYLLEGMAVRGEIRGNVPNTMIPWLKDQLEAMFADVQELDRQSARSEPDE